LVDSFGGSWPMLALSTLFAAVNFLSIMGIASGLKVRRYPVERRQVACAG
jgi:hypothetical protein